VRVIAPLIENKGSASAGDAHTAPKRATGSDS